MKSMRKLSAFFLSAACAAAGAAVVLQTPAFAVDGNRHCVAKVGSDTEKQGDPVCFSKFSQAVSYATGGAVRFSDDTTTVTKKQLEKIYAAPRTAVAETVVIGLSFVSQNFQGNSWTHTASAGCDDDSAREWYYQFNSAWNDQTSSADAAARCTGIYWEAGHGTYGSGAWIRTGWSGGPMDNRATFIDWA